MQQAQLLKMKQAQLSKIYLTFYARECEFGILKKKKKTKKKNDKNLSAVLINFNALKCIVLRIREAIRYIIYIYTLDGVNLESVDSQKDLGVTISKTLKPATHIDIITKKAHQKIGMIKRCFTKFTEKKVTTL